MAFWKGNRTRTSKTMFPSEKQEPRKPRKPRNLENQENQEKTKKKQKQGSRSARLRPRSMTWGECKYIKS